MAEWKKREITRAWAIIKPDGDIVLDSAFSDEKTAWEVVLGYPHEDEIREAKCKGYRAIFASVVV